MAGAKLKVRSKPALHEFLSAALKFKSPGVRLALERQPVLTVLPGELKAEAALFDVAPTSAEKLEALFREIASPDQRRRLKRDGRARFIYVFETSLSGQRVVGGFRVEAKAVNGHVVLMTCQNLRRYSAATEP